MSQTHVEGKMDKQSTTNQANLPTVKPVRLHYIDWVRLLATIGVFLYHATRPFGQLEGQIKNDEISIVITVIFLLFLGPFGMPLFFMMAGASTKFALTRRSGSQYAMERIKRLVIPFVVGVILLTPIEFYIMWVFNGEFEGSFLRFLPEFFQSILSPSLKELLNPSIFEYYGFHLWFLGFLFSFSMISLPIFLWLKSDTGGRFITKLAELWERRGGFFIFVIPIMLARLLLQPFFPEYTSWADFSFFLLYFIYGYIVYSNDRFMNVVKRDWKLALITGIGSSMAMIGIAAVLEATQPGLVNEWYINNEYLGFYLVWALISINSWSWVMVALYLAEQKLNFRNKWLEYGQEALLPFYVLHQLVIFIFAFYILKWEAGILTKLSALILSSFVITLALHEFVIKRLKPARALFGMKQRTRSM
jgi:hypothetical protein